ncbi:MAG TPA: 2Fe-2S iron-sulfur cluster-binding protein [Steroidobacteraceae bacterium]|nr:2Fe-2S iron-sulfur cluster-binding protein [Steroidobacteraceae bacterium]
MSRVQSHRLPAGGRIDRSRAVEFRFDARRYQGFAGDTLASALLANGVRVVGRSFKFHRPRGVLSAGVEEPNALVTIGEGGRMEPNARATLLPLTDGLAARSQNAWPRLGFDVRRAADYVHRLLPPGFYHKTFKWPGWHWYESAIRQSAGLGPAPVAADPDQYDSQNGACDVLVVGGGAAGLAAAIEEAQTGASVWLLEQDRDFGGAVLSEPLAAATERNTWIIAAASRLEAMANVRLLLKTTCLGVYDHGVVMAVERLSHAVEGSVPILRERYWRIRAGRIVLATGAIEQPALFRNNDLPGVMLAGSVRQYLNRYAVACGRRVAIVTADDEAYRTALDLADAGIRIAAIVDTRAGADGELPRRARERGLAIYQAADAVGAEGRSRVRALRIVPAQSSRLTIDCDLVAMSSGWQPALHLYCHAGGKLAYDEERKCLLPKSGPVWIQVIGAAAGATLSIPEFADVVRGRTGARRQPDAQTADRSWVDFQHDVTAADIGIAVRENYVSVEHLKRYTTTGMSVDQGKTSNVNALTLLARLTQRSIADTGTTTFRPPFTPVTLGAIAGGRSGRFYRPTRELPTHELQIELAAVFEEFGGWQRPVAYPRPGETTESAIEREVRTVRSTVGLFEASPLGKILVRGADAAEFIDRVYATTMSTLALGQARYGLMLNEKGVIIDDGVCTRIGDDGFWVSTTSGGATGIANWFDEWLQCEWPALRVVATPVTTEWATVTLAGPKARDVLANLPGDFNFLAPGFGHLRARAGSLDGIDCRIFRVSFSGELSYEINVPAGSATALWRKLLAAGAPHGIAPFGIEALMTMRIEKGYLHVGSDTDGTTVPDDVGFGAAVAKKRGDFIGRRSLSMPENVRQDRLQLVGLRALDAARPLVAGAHLAEQGSIGYVTSACRSPTLGTSIGLGLLKRGRARMGERLRVFDNGVESAAEVLSPMHYDPQGTRLHG